MQLQRIEYLGWKKQNSDAITDPRALSEFYFTLYLAQLSLSIVIHHRICDFYTFYET